MTDSLGQVIKLINDTNLPLKLLDLKNVVYGTPQAVETPEGERYNTSMLLTGVPAFGYWNSVTVLYTRLDMSELVTDQNVRSVEPLTKPVLVDLLNRQYNLFLTVDDVEDYEVPDIEAGSTAPLTVVIKDDSKGFVNQIDLIYFHGKPYLDVIIPVRTLNALPHPTNTIYHVMSARMLTWGIDFTSARPALTIDPKTGRFKDRAAVQQVTAALGIPNWSDGPVSDLATSAVADANPAFERVMIQRNVTSTGMMGDVYLHYNVLEEA